jgi:L-ribulose-5-phosphate 3-epimerase
MNRYSRRQFLIDAPTGAASLGLASVLGVRRSSATAVYSPAGPVEAFPRPQKDGISLALFSLNRSFNVGMWNLMDIPRICREDFNIDGIEYVSIYFKDVRYQPLLRPLKQRAADYGITNVLIMVDQEGDMGSPDKAERMQSMTNHRKWLQIAAYLGCFAIRINCTGTGRTVAEDPDALERSAESFNALIEYAKEFKMVVMLENHGAGLASNPEWIAALAKKINNPNFGLMPDFGNFGFAEPEKTYQAIRTTMPYAFDVSVKGSWNADGTHARFSLEEALRIAKEEFHYVGFWGIESSIRREKTASDALSPLQIKNDDWTAVKWTADVIRKVVMKKA